ncbi:hypothetical protein Tco_0270861 [Tanacetum coccineum]
MLEIKVYETGNQEEIFSSEACRRVFDINEPIYTELCHEFYSTYKFDEVCDDDEVRTNKVIKFQLCGRAHSLTLLEFARRLDLYHSDEVNKEGFDVYFQGGLRGDENFNATHYWLSISTAEELHLSRSLALTIWTDNEDCEEDEVLNSLSAPTYYRDLDTTTLKEMIDSEGRLILEVPALGVPRVAVPKGPRPSMQDLYDRMGSMEIRQGAIERMTYRQSYHWDMYHGVFEHMAGVYDVPLQGAYNPPGYDH